MAEKYTVKYWLKDGSSHTHGGFGTQKQATDFIKTLDESTLERWNINDVVKGTVAKAG